MNNAFGYIIVNRIFSERYRANLETSGAGSRGVSQVTATATGIGQLCANRLAPISDISNVAYHASPVRD
jgi:hypothetical protein